MDPATWTYGAGTASLLGPIAAQAWMVPPAPPVSYPYQQQHQQHHHSSYQRGGGGRGGRGGGRGGGGGSRPFQQQQQPMASAAEATFLCAPCGKAYTTDAMLAAHKTQHVHCGRCEYEAMPKMVKVHEAQVHDGTMPKLPSLDTPEDIAAWIAARKARWPKEGAAPAPKASHGKRGLQPQKKARQPEETPSGLALLSAYASDEDGEVSDVDNGDDDGDEDKQEDKMDEDAPQRGGSNRGGRGGGGAGAGQRKQCVYFARGHCRSGRRCRFAHTKEGASATASPSRAGKTSSQPGGGRGRGAAAASSSSRMSVVDRLMHQDIERRRNEILLECLQHISAKNFYQ